MKPVLRAITVLALLGVMPLSAQLVTPATPKNFKTRAVGGDVTTGAEIEGASIQSTVRYVAHIVIGESRLWTSSDGRPLTAKLIAFEDLVAEAPKGRPQPPMPAPPAVPTVVKNGKARLLVEKKAMEIPLDRLSSRDREFIDEVRASLAKQGRKE